MQRVNRRGEAQTNWLDSYLHSTVSTPASRVCSGDLSRAMQRSGAEDLHPYHRKSTTLETAEDAHGEVTGVWILFRWRVGKMSTVEESQCLKQGMPMTPAPVGR